MAGNFTVTNVMTQKFRHVGIASAIWGFSILLSRVIGLVRETVIGRMLGASREADIYWAAFVLPDFLNYLLAAGALSIVFIPIFSGYLVEGRPHRGWEAFSVIANFVGGACLLALVALSLGARPLVEVVAPGFSPEEIDSLTRLTRIMLPAQFFHIVGGLLSAVLQARDRHLLPALAPLVYSGCIILGGLVGAPWIGAEGFAWGVLAGSVAGPFGLPFIGCLRSELPWRPIFRFRHPDLRRYLVLSLPIMLGFSIIAVDEWILKNQASYLPAGAVSTLQYARTLMKVPIGVFGLAAGVAAYPTLSRMMRAGDFSAAYTLISRAVRLLLLAVLGAQVCLTVAGEDVVYAIWGLFGGRFTLQDAQAAAACLAFLSLGLGGWAIQTVLARGFYAMGNTWLPTLVGSAVVVALLPLYVTLREAMGVRGLALASSTAILAYVTILGTLLQRSILRKMDPTGQSAPPAGTRLGPTLLRLVAATALSIFLAIGLRGLVLQSLPGFGALAILGRVALLSAASAGLYLGIAHLLGVQELGELAGMLRRQIRRGRGAAGDPPPQKANH